MTFPTLDFAVFFAVVLPASWLLMPYRRPRKIFIIVASYFFYGSSDVHFVFLLAGCTLWNAAMAHFLWVARSRKRIQSAVLGVAIVGDLCLRGQTTVTPAVLLAIATGFCVQFLPRASLLEARMFFGRLSPLAQSVSLSLVLFLTGVLVTGQGVAPFIYYRF
jgi:D-alanyl-lipoteichoic acid acyltransferase DltB (MBOAT superfamily)